MRIFLFAALLFLAFPAFAQEAGVNVDLASDHVDINTGFNGTDIALFGVRRKGGDVAVIVEGPLRAMAVRRKAKVFGAWINSSSETYKHVPSYYNYALSRPLEYFAPPDVLARYHIGPETLGKKEGKARKGDKDFHDALLRNKRRQGLFPEKPGSIDFLSPDFFRADFYIPANVPVGEYKIRTLHFVNGAVQGELTRTVRVAQVGFSADIHDFAYGRSFLYGCMCVMLAIFAGWISNRVRKG